MNTLAINQAKANHIILPLIFILMWSSGYIVGKIGLEYAGPYTLLFIRLASATVILFFFSLFTKAKWPTTWKQTLHLAVVGLLVQGIHFSSLYTAMNLGVSAGMSALIIGTLPLFAALLSAKIFAEKVGVKQWLGALLGLLGVGLIVMNQGHMAHAQIWGYFFAILALCSLTVGSLYQKYFCQNIDLRSAGCIQLAASAVLTCFLSGYFEHFHMHFTFGLLYSSAWLSLINSIGAISILFVLMARGEASKVTSLFHLIPGATAIASYIILGEVLSVAAIIGFLITGLAVYLSHR